MKANYSIRGSRGGWLVFIQVYMTVARERSTNRMNDMRILLRGKTTGCVCVCVRARARARWTSTLVTGTAALSLLSSIPAALDAEKQAEVAVGVM